MTVVVTNAQHEAPVNVARMTRLARCAARRLSIRTRGTLQITFMTSQAIRRLNRQFLRYDRPTDVLSFRYDGESIAGEIFIAPTQARRYAKEHHVSYAEELGRYVAHGLLHWLGHDDRTVAQQRQMRTLEDQLLAQCGSHARL